MIIGISGKKQSGKDTVGRIIQYLLECPNSLYNEEELIHWLKKDKLPHWFVTDGSVWKLKSFANKVKQILSIITGIPVKDMENEDVKNSYLSGEWYLEVIDHCCNQVGIKSYPDKNGNCSNCGNKIVFFKPIKVRQALQMIGTDLFRNQFNENVWINALFSDYNAIEYNSQPFDTEPHNVGSHDKIIFPKWIITDTRFINEAEAILDRDGLLIRINDDNMLIGNHYDELGVIPKKLWRDASLGFKHQSEIELDNYNEFNYIINNSGTLEELIEKVKQILIKEKLYEINNRC